MKEGEEIFVIHVHDELYPKQLLHIPDAPQKLYVRGNKALLGQQHAFSVVGSREVSEYGRRAIDFIVSGLTHHFIIISGMALGADALAHVIALSKNTPTIAVLGSGLDDESIYPRTHVNLAQQIINSGGCLISEYEPGTRARPEYFPARNRIVAGLSVGVLIAEAAKKSGTMITARLALDYGRDVFIVPGSIFSPLSEGVHWLLKQGATPVTTSQDILDMYGIRESPKNSRRTSHSPEERLIIDCVMNGCVRIDEIQLKTQIPIQKLLGLIMLLELEGHIKNEHGTLKTY